MRALLAAVVLSASVAVWFAAGWGGTTVVRWADDLLLGAASAGAAACCWRVARTAGEARRSWQLIGAGAAAWTAGQVVWTVHDAAFGGPTPMPYYDDLGYLALPLMALVALVRMPSAANELARWRWGLDAAIVTISMFLLVFSPIIEPTIHTDASLRSIAVAVVFPVIDVLLLSAVVLGFAYRRAGRGRLLAVAIALGWLAVADTSFSFLDITGHYHPGALCDAAYFAAFALLTAATFVEQGTPRAAASLAVPEQVRVVLPYVPFAAAGCVLLVRDLMGQGVDSVDLVLGAVVTACMLARQALVLSENQRLLCTVRRQHEELLRSAMTDSLTGLVNRAVFNDRATHATLLHARDMRKVSLAWIDLDDFKLVNDTCGHAAGDQLLVTVGERLRGAMRMGDTVARLGGDEFAVLIEDGSDPTLVAERICSELRRPFVIDGALHTVTASVGVAILEPGDVPLDPAELLSRADVAMYEAKKAGKNRVAVYGPGMTLPGTEDAMLRDPLRRAIDARDIGVVFQPLVSAADGTLRGFEALARWTHRGRPIAPEEFVALAERAGLGCALGDCIIDRTLGEASAWLRAREGIVIGVNLAPSQVNDAAFPGRLRAMLERHRVGCDRLVLEITEAALLTESSQPVATVHQLAAMGIRLSLDDFGTGYSSLAHLRRFPLASVKIDRTFVEAVDTAAQPRAFIAAVIRLGHDLGLDVIVEGIESPGQLAVVRDLGATYVQGFLIDRPRPEAEIDLWRDWSALFAQLSPVVPTPRHSLERHANLAGGAGG